MKNTTFYATGAAPAIRVACRELAKNFHIAGRAAPDVTHLLLPVPSFETDGRIKGGGVLENILADLNENITIIGGNLHHPALAGYKKLDLLQDGEYVAQNAALTADCAVRVAGANLPVSFHGSPMLVVGWGRIGKCLAANLRALGAEVAIAARKAEDRNVAAALGYGTENTHQLTKAYSVIFNTAPAPVLGGTVIPRGTVKIELSSATGLSGSDVIIARGLPGKMVPETSGMLIARRITEILTERKE